MNSKRAEEKKTEKKTEEKTTGQKAFQIFLYVLAAIAILLMIYYGGPVMLSFMSST